MRCRSGGLDGADENKRPFLWEGAGPPGLGGASGVRGGAQSPSCPGRGPPCVEALASRRALTPLQMATASLDMDLG